MNGDPTNRPSKTSDLWFWIHALLWHCQGDTHCDKCGRVQR